MRNTILTTLAIIFASFCLSACVKNQQTPDTPSTQTYDQTNTAATANINDTNYEDELREQSARAAGAEAAHGGGGGHGR